jgi:CubicO group peptidase (beta-lactamase class C family)
LRKILKWIGSVAAGIVGLTLLAWITYPFWGGFGDWIDQPGVEAPASSAVLDERFSAAAEGAMQALVAHRRSFGFPAITAAVSFDGAVIWTGAVGWADLETRTPATAATVFRIGSTSKAVTATALARLLDQGRVTLDAPLSTYAPSWPNPAWNDLTIRQLASHTAGFPEYEGNRDLFGLFMTLCGCKHYSSVRESLEIFDDTGLRYEPGTDFFYSSFDVTLLGAVLAEVEGEPFLAVLDRLVFRPLHVESAGGAEDGQNRPGLATFYQMKGGRARVWRPFDLSQRWPSGGLVATSADLVRIGGAWMDSTFIRPETRKAMWTPQLLRNGEVNEQRYALGWRFYPDATWPGDPSRILSYAHHGGISRGAMSWLVVYPDFKLSIAVNMNTRAEVFSDFSAVEDRIAALFLRRIETLRPGPVEGW